MPILLMQAFKLTGSPEYGFRAQAALNALPSETQALVLGHLRIAYGDLYIQADFEELVSLSGPEVIGALFTAAGVELTVAPDAPRIRLVLDGSNDSYGVTVNERPLGDFAVAGLRAGIDLELPA
jgi:hypothetical protein